MSIFNKLATLGKALMLPIAVMPVAGLLLRCGQGDLLGRFFDASFISAAGNAIFGHLALIFGVGVAVGLAKKNHGAAALAAVVSYYVLTGVMDALSLTMYMNPIKALQSAIYNSEILGKTNIDLLSLINSANDIPSKITADYLDKIHYLAFYNHNHSGSEITKTSDLLANINDGDVSNSIAYMFTHNADAYTQGLLKAVTSAIDKLSNVKASAMVASTLDPQAIVDAITSDKIADAFQVNASASHEAQLAMQLSHQVADTAVKATKSAIMGDINGALSPAPKLDMGVLGGIIAGLVGAYSYNKFHTARLPDVLAFFSGRRLAPIMAGLISLIIGIVAAFIWGHIQDLIGALANGLVSLGWVGSFIYGVLNRLLLSLGLHNVMNVYFWFNLGDFTNAQGIVVHGDITRFFAGDLTAGNFMAGFFPVMMFGLPGAGLAMYLNANPENKKEVGGLLLSVCVTAFLTGITEPIEYMFMFIAPALYLIHALLMGVSLAISTMFTYHMGFTFSGGAFDAIMNYSAPAARNPWMLFILGPIFFVVYLVIFSVAIKMFNIKTPGREEPDLNAVLKSDLDFTEMEKAEAYIKALGGLDNITSIDNCITRLRLELKDVTKIDKDAISHMDNQGTINPGGNSLQIIIGGQVEFIANAMREIQDGLVASDNGSHHATTKADKIALAQAAKEVTVVSPVEGTIVDLSDVPDITFAERIVGDGIAVQPEGNKICAPVSGEIISLPKESHAFIIKADNGLEFLVHVGLETVMLRGKGFRTLATVGTHVEAGDAILQVNWDEIIDEVPSTVIPVLCASMGSTSSFHVTATIGSTVKTGDKLFEIVSK